MSSLSDISTPAPATENVCSSPRFLCRRTKLVLLGLVGSVVVGLAVAFLVWPRDVRAALLRIDGAVVMVEPAVTILPIAADQTLKPIPEDEKAPSDNISFRITNLLDKPVRILGSESSCTCIQLDKLPLTIPSGGDVELRFEMARRNAPFEYSIRLHTDPVGTDTRLVVRGQ